MKPDDLAWPNLHVSNCVIDGEEGIPGSIQPADTPRATATRYFASEAGVGFEEVRCVAGYIKLWTRQDSWDCAGRSRYADDVVDALEAEGAIHIGRQSLTWTWSDGSDAEEYIEAQTPDEPPPTWEPVDYDPVWEFVDKKHPRAIKVWVCKLKEDT